MKRFLEIGDIYSV